MSGRRLLALVMMLPMSALVLAAYLCEALGLFGAAERIDRWACPKIAALMQWVERGEV